MNDVFMAMGITQKPQEVMGEPVADVNDWHKNEESISKENVNIHLSQLFDARARFTK